MKRNYTKCSAGGGSSSKSRAIADLSTVQNFARGAAQVSAKNIVVQGNFVSFDPL
jgi:hypothetical protein